MMSSVLQVSPHGAWTPPCRSLTGSAPSCSRRHPLPPLCLMHCTPAPVFGGPSSKTSRRVTTSAAQNSESAQSAPGPSTSAAASASASSTQQASNRGMKEQELRLPRSGYFSIADTKAEVYSKAGERFDPKSKGGRYKSSFIWNTNWQEALQREESLQAKADAANARRAAAREVGANSGAPITTQLAEADGTVSLARMADLDRMDVDLSHLLRPRPKPAPAAEYVAAPSTSSRSSSSSGAGPRSSAGGSRQPIPVAMPARRRAAMASYNSAAAFTRKEVSRLERTTASLARATPAKAIIVRNSEQQEEVARAAAVELAKYESVKVDSQVWTVILTVAGTALTYFYYTTDVTASYMVGALGGWLYLRLLSRSVDALAGGGGGIGGIASQQRLLIPVILALVYNRWNQLYAHDTGITLQLLPELVGFFTYKFAVVARQSKEVLDNLSPNTNTQDSARSSSSS